jgi:succinate dehydrogenase / fumarate reductase membrane anchor subunit
MELGANMKKKYNETSNRGAIAWLLQRISAVLLFFLIIFHYITYHFISTGAPEWESVILKMQSPWFNLLQFLFLILALYHGFNGVWMVVEDYLHSKFWRILIFSIIIVLGSSLFFVGMLTIFKISAIKLGV